MRLRTTLPLAMMILASPALAEITADDVWSNTTAYYAATGGDLSATLTRDGSTIFVDDVLLTYAFPFDAGTLKIGLPPMTMIEEADGSVTQKLPKAIDLAFEANFGRGFSDAFAFDLAVTQADFTASATGTPGDITYTRNADAVAATITLRMPDDVTEGIDFNFVVTGEGYQSSTRVAEGDLLTVTSENTVLPMSVNYSSDEGFGFRTEGSGEYGTTITRTSMALPRDGADIMNLAPALAAGAFVEMTSTAAGSSDRSTTYLDNEILIQDSTRVGTTQSGMSLSTDGLEFTAEGDNIGVTYVDQEFLGIEIAVDLAHVDARYHMPLMASDTPQQVAFSLNLDEITLNEETWDLADPERAIPRDPANLNIDLSGEVGLGVDLLDFMALERAFARSELPVTLNAMTIDQFDLNVAGAAASGSGQFTFDNTDLNTFSGFPRPEGRASVVLTGVNALLDTLIDAGLVPQQEVGMGRMMMGMFTRPTGDNELTAEVELNAEGHLIVNGERLR